MSAPSTFTVTLFGLGRISSASKAVLAWLTFRDFPSWLT